MSAAPADVVVVRRLLAAVAFKASCLADTSHPGWVEAACEAVGWPRESLRARVQGPRTSALLAAAYGVRWPTLADFRLPVHRVAVLDLASTQRVLGLCALVAARAAVRRIVSRDIRVRLQACVGQPAFDWMMSLPAHGGSDLHTPSLPELDPIGLAEAGHGVLGAEGCWQSHAVSVLVRMSLPPERRPRPGGHPNLGMAVEEVIGKISIFYPELQWLFGSDMDRALSA